MKQRYGWFVKNGFLHGKKFSSLCRWISEAAVRAGVTLVTFSNDELFACYRESQTEICIAPHARNKILSGQEKTESFTGGGQKPDFVLFWDKDIPLARALEAWGVSVYNCADAIEACDDKGRTHHCLSRQGIRMPKTLAVPMTYANIGYNDVTFLELFEEELGYPFVLKECFGSFGAQVYLIHSREEAEAFLKRLSGTPLLAQEYIHASSGRDVRIHMVGGEPVTAMLRYNPSDFRANITNGGQMQVYQPSKEQIALARAACVALKLDFAGVDLLFGPQGEPVLCEVNSNAHFENIYHCTGVNVADAIFSYICGKSER